MLQVQNTGTCTKRIGKVLGPEMAHFLHSFQNTRYNKNVSKKQKKAQAKKTIRLGDRSIEVSNNLFGGLGHVEYTGYGYHMNDKTRAQNRRNRKEDERRAKLGYE